MTTDDELVESVAREWKRDREEARAAEAVAATSVHDALAAKIVEDAARALGPVNAKTNAKVEPARGSNVRRIAAWVAAPLAIAAAIALFLGRGAKVDGPLPPYAASWDGDRMQRSPGAPQTEALALSTFGNVEIVIRPSTPVTGPVEAHGAIVRGNDTRAWNPRLRVSSEGAVRISGPSHEIFDVPAGEWLAIVAIGRPGDVPTDPQVIAAGPAAADARWQVFKKQVLFRAVR